MTRTFLFPVFMVLSVAASFAQDTTNSSIDVTGSFDLGVRFRDASGNEDKYFEHLNYRSGPRLFNLNLDITSVDSDAFDTVNVYGSGIGGDPYEVFGVTVKKFGAYNLRYRRNRSQYFYRDTILPHDEASLEASSGGDFHTFDVDRTNDMFHFDVQAASDVNVFVKFNRQERLRDSTTTFDVERDEFELDAPLKQLKNDYSVGVQAVFSRVSIYFDQGYRQYRNDGRIFLPGASPGENVEDTSTLFFFEQLLPLDFDMPETTFKVNVRPSSRLSVNVGLIYNTLDGRFDVSEEDRGISFDASEFDRLLTGQGSLDSQTTLADIDIVYDAGRSVAIIGGARFHRYDQEASVDLSLEDLLDGEIRVSPTVTTAVDIGSNIFEVGARMFPDTRYQVTGGLRFENRDVRTLDHEEPTTERTSFFLNGVVKPSRDWNVLAEYELGDYQNPFTRVSPTRLDRFKLRVRYHPAAVEGLSVNGSILARRFDNDLTDYALSTHNYTLHLRYQLGPALAYGGYSRQDWDAAIVNEVRTAPGFLGGQSFEHASLYDYKVDMFTGGLAYDVTAAVHAGVDWSVYNNRGSFGQDFRQVRLFTDLVSPAGYVFRLMYWRNSYDEIDFDFDDYSSNIFTLSVGYAF